MYLPLLSCLHSNQFEPGMKPCTIVNSNTTTDKLIVFNQALLANARITTKSMDIKLQKSVLLEASFKKITQDKLWYLVNCILQKRKFLSHDTNPPQERVASIK